MSITMIFAISGFVFGSALILVCLMADWLVTRSR